MTSHTCDGNYRTWMEIVPAARYERDTTVAIYNGRMTPNILPIARIWN